MSEEKDTIDAAAEVVGAIDATGLDAASAATLAVMQRHAQAMASRDGDTIAADYAVDTVVYTMFVGKDVGAGGHEPVLGRQGIADWINTYLEEFEAALAPAEGQAPAMLRFTAHGEYGHLAIDLGDGRHGTETYVVRDNEIVFESATFFV